ncbi:protein mono-ADP-ribosyltransferase PARP9 isoform X1 [Echinops telfairi]|uniref:Protein mono-ADP-ribosyltransferase PARP9 isoform X1 n=3 Tax=Echinops telfairi TaxID=9371 RepID=A0AC55CVF1_ECHTE|nr:protein mono-ADP-ribosyltransferase PARP9 isoform X1 [Echinops telfairi]XP_045143482.1 protein mono-ADP-ribosyltransferase PARP9 isoform X1 [Echinops telfairi]
MDSYEDLGVTAFDELSEKEFTMKTVEAHHENLCWHLPINHDDFKILKNHESRLFEVLQNKFGCISTLDSPALKGHMKPLPIFRKMLTPWMELSVWKDDLTKHVVDAVVNAANGFLSHGAGLAGALVKVGGPEIQEESLKIIATHGQIPPGQIGITKAGRLPCKLIIHAVGPQWTMTDGEKCVHVLRMTIHNILQFALSNPDIESVAIPAISSGIFGFPLRLCTHTILETIRAFFHSTPVAGNLKQIHLVSNEDPTVAAFKVASENILGPSELESSMVGANMAKVVSVLQGGNEKRREYGPTADSPVINLMGSNEEEMSEAKEWIQKILALQKHHIIENNHILYFGKKEFDVLSQLQEATGVSISESINPGKTQLEIKGARPDLIEAVMCIETMLCRVQEEMARENEQHLQSLLKQWTDKQPQTLGKMQGNTSPIKFRELLSAQELQDKKKQLEKGGFQVIKVEKINNEALKAVFQAKKKMMEGRASLREPVSRRLFQQVPRQFCDVICRVGFHRMYSAPCDPKYGAGIYFTKNLRTLADQIKKTTATDKLIYVFEAEVLTGSFCQGGQLHIVPPPLSPGGTDGHDSVVDNVASPETFVIFNGTQAVPQYLWICTQDQGQSQNYSFGQMVPSFSNWILPIGSSVF